MKEEILIKYMKEKKFNKEKYVCWDFVRDIYKDNYKIELPEYPTDEIQAEFKKYLTSNINHIKIKNNDIKEGDIIVFSLFANQHAGVMIDNENFIHLSEKGVQTCNIKNIRGNYVVYRIVK